MTSCPLDLSKPTLRHGLAIVYVIMISILSVFMVQVYKAFTEQQDLYKEASMKAAMNGMPPANLNKMCFSSSSSDVLHKFIVYKNIVFYSIVASFIYLVFYLAFENKLPKEKWVASFVYVPLVIVGVVAMAFSVDGFLKIRSLTNQPVECKDIIDRFKNFFIISMAMAVAQTFVAMWLLKNLYIVIKL